MLQKCTWKHAPSPAIHMAKVKGDDETHASRRPEAWGVCVCVCVCVLVVGGRGSNFYFTTKSRWEGAGRDQRQNSREETDQNNRRHQYLRYTALED